MKPHTGLCGVGVHKASVSPRPLPQQRLDGSRWCPIRDDTLRAEHRALACASEPETYHNAERVRIHRATKAAQLATAYHEASERRDPPSPLEFGRAATNPTKTTNTDSPVLSMFIRRCRASSAPSSARGQRAPVRQVSTTTHTHAQTHVKLLLAACVLQKGAHVGQDATCAARQMHIQVRVHLRAISQVGLHVVQHACQQRTLDGRHHVVGAACWTGLERFDGKAPTCACRGGFALALHGLVGEACKGRRRQRAAPEAREERFLFHGRERRLVVVVKREHCNACVKRREASRRATAAAGAGAALS